MKVLVTGATGFLGGWLVRRLLDEGHDVRIIKRAHSSLEDIEGLNAADIPLRLGIAPSSEYLVIQFPTPTTGIATPLAFDHPLFVGGGLTSGGAREFFVANDFIPKIATIEVVK